MRFIMICVGVSLVLLTSLIYTMSMNGFGFISNEPSQRFNKIVKIEEEQARIDIHDLIIFGGQPRTFAIAGKTDSLGRRQLLTSLDSILSVKNYPKWARKTLESYDWAEQDEPTFTHKGGYIPFYNIDSLYETEYIHEIYRMLRTNFSLDRSLSFGTVFNFLLLFLIAFFTLSISNSWNFTKRTLFKILIFLIGISIIYIVYSKLNTNTLSSELSNYRFVYQFLHWLFFGLIILFVILLRSIFKSEYRYQGFMFLVIVFSFPLAAYMSQYITTLIDYNFYNSILHYDHLGLTKGIIENMISGFGLGAAGLTVFAINNFNRIKENQRKAVREQLAIKEQLNSLNARLNPHFLYNSLNAIAGLIKQDPDKAEKITLAISRFLKHFSNRKEEHIITIGEEIKMILDYISIEKIRFGNKLSFQIEASNEVKHKFIPRSLLQPLIENAIKYGFNEERDIIDVKLHIGLKEGQVHIKIHDSGPVFDCTLNKGYGISSAYNKLDLLYNGHYSVEFVNTPQKHIEIILDPYNLIQDA